MLLIPRKSMDQNWVNKHCEMVDMPWLIGGPQSAEYVLRLGTTYNLEKVRVTPDSLFVTQNGRHTQSLSWWDLLYER